MKKTYLSVAMRVLRVERVYPIPPCKQSAPHANRFPVRSLSISNPALQAIRNEVSTQEF